VTGRVLFYVQHLLGIGHLKRAEILARAIAAEGLDVTVALGGAAVPSVPFEGVRTAPLPPAGIADEDFSILRDSSGQPVDENWRARRRAALLDLFRSVAPDILLIELFPFGRRQFAFELLPLLAAAHAAQPRPFVACSVRDILVRSGKAGRAEEVAATVRRWFDAVLVHGDPALIPLAATFPAADQIADLIRYTGYVAETGPPVPTEGDGEVIVSAGGGAVGAPLLFAAMAARPVTPVADRAWRFLTGPNFPAEAHERLAAMADDRCVVEPFRTDFSARLRNAALSISQAGYNTIVDVLRAGVPAVVVPYERPGETEQRLRSEILAAKGLLTIVPEAELSATRLIAAVSNALAQPRRIPDTIDLSGAATTARLVRDRLAPGRRAQAEEGRGRSLPVAEFHGPIGR
jgi:predicted glycosyltransferase